MSNIKLKYPITVDGVTYNELNMRRSKVRDRLAVTAMKCSDEQKEITMFANLCEVAPKVIEELDETDYASVQKVYMGFFGSGPETSDVK